MTTFTSLPKDVLVEFLRHLDSLDDVLAMISTAKYVYETFNVHPNYILRGVICRMLPMDEEVFPVALGFILQAGRTRPSDPTVTPKKSSLSDEDLSATCVTPTRFWLLLKQHECTLRLEEDFSRLTKDSRFGYSTLTREESRRFQIAAYTYGQFRALFGIERGARVQPWEYGSESVSDGQITSRAFLDSLSTSRICQLAILKDFIFPWTNSIYIDALTWNIPGLSDLSKEQYCHLLLSTGLDMIKYPHRYGRHSIQKRLPNHYTYQKLWLADDLSASICQDFGYSRIRFVFHAHASGLGITYGPQSLSFAPHFISISYAFRSSFTI